MKVLYSWLQDFVAVSASPEELASRLALSGTNIGGIENGPHGAVIDAEVSSNRPDCLGHYGVAREVGAIYKLALKKVSPKPSESAAKTSEAIKVEIHSPELCGRFTARMIRKCVPQRQRLFWSAFLISGTDGLGFFFKNAAACIIMPLMQ